MLYEIKKRSFSESLSETFRLFVTHFRPLFLVSLLSSIPAVINSNISIPAVTQGPEFEAFIKRIAFQYAIMIVVNTFASGLIIEYISKHYLKRVESFSQYIMNVLFLFFPIIGLAAFQIVFAIGAFLPVVYPILSFMFILTIYFVPALSIMPQVLIIERKSILSSFRRGIFLTKGNKLEIFGYLAIILFIFLCGAIISSFLALLLERSGVGDGVQRLITHLINVLIFPINACLLILAYFNVMIDKDGVKTNSSEEVKYEPNSSEGTDYTDHSKEI